MTYADYRQGNGRFGAAAPADKPAVASDVGEIG